MAPSAISAGARLLGWALAQLSADHDVTIVASLFERRAPGLYHNTLAVIDGEKGYLGKYRKMHIPDDPGYYEKFYFTPGDLGFQPIATSVGKLGVLICWDQWFPEAARSMVLMGAEILFYPTAIGSEPTAPSTIRPWPTTPWWSANRSSPAPGVKP